MPDEILYLIKAQCPACTAIVRHVEARSEPVNLMQDVTITTSYCPKCGMEIGEWDLHEESEIGWAETREERDR